MLFDYPYATQLDPFVGKKEKGKKEHYDSAKKKNLDLS